MKKTAADFNEIINRTEVATLKFDAETMQGIFGAGDLWPSRVAELDFRSAPEIVEALNLRIAHGVFGYESTTPEPGDAVVNW